MLEKCRLVEQVTGRCTGTGVAGGGIRVPFETKVGQQLLHGRLPIQYFYLLGVVFGVGPFHGIELIRRWPRRCPEHTAGPESGHSRPSGEADQGSPNPACTRPPT